MRTADRIAALLTRLFGPPEEVNGAHRCPSYLFHWIFLSTRWCKAYVHRFVADDWSLDLHDHPKRFVSIGLWGRYTEWTPCALKSCAVDAHHVPRVFKAQWFRTFPATHIHRVTLPRYCGGCGAADELSHTAGCYIPLFLPRECWTLVIVFRPVRDWGFYHRGRFIPWRRYVMPGGTEADARKACP